MNMYTIYLDMDGVLADFDKEVKALKHLDEQPWLTIPGFFKNLEVIGNPDSMIKTLKNYGHTVKILSKVEVRDTLARAFDKMAWVQKNLPSMNTEDVIIVPYHEKKIDFIQSNISTSILVDDYSVNLKEWAQFGGMPVKFRQGEKKDNYQFLQINDLAELDQIV